MTVNIVAIGIAIFALLVGAMFFLRKRRELTERDKRIILRDEEIVRAKKKIKEVHKIMEKKNKEYQDALDEYNSKYRSNK